MLKDITRQSRNVLMQDSYKSCHFRHYPEDLEQMMGYLEARESEFGYNVFLGTANLVDNLFTNPITKDNVDEQADLMERHGLSFNYNGWMSIVDEKGGYLPLEVRAVDEGTLVPEKNVMLTVRNTDEKYP